MSEIAEFLHAQYDRMEKRELGKFTVPYRPNLRCPACDHPVEETIYTSGEDHVRFEPCGHTMPNVEYVERFGKSDADPFVLADIASKRRILDEVVDEATSLDMSVDNDRRVGPRDEAAEPYIGEILLRLLAAPFSGEPGYKEGWSV